MRRLECLIPPPLVALIVGALMWALAYATARLDLPRDLMEKTAAAVATAGVALAAWSVVTFRRAGANINPHHIDRGEALVTGGPYRFSRNPMYLSLTLVLCGYAIYLSRPVVLLGPMLFVAYLTRFQILPEERAMQAKFGAAFAEYARATRRWI